MIRPMARAIVVLALSSLVLTAGSTGAAASTPSRCGVTIDKVVQLQRDGTAVVTGSCSGNLDFVVALSQIVDGTNIRAVGVPVRSSDIPTAFTAAVKPAVGTFRAGQGGTVTVQWLDVTTNPTAVEYAVML